MTGQRPPLGGRTARPARARPAGRGDGAAGPVLCVAPAGVGQDDDAGRPGRLAGRRRRGPGVDRASWRSTSGRPRSSTERLDAALAPLGLAGRIGPGPHVPCARAARSSREAGVSVEPLDRSRRAPARAVPRGGRRRPRAARPRLLAPQARPRRHRRRRRARSGAGPGRARVRRLRGARSRELGGVDFDDLVVRALGLLVAEPALLATLAATVRATCSSTRRRTSTGPSSSWRCSSRRRRTTDLPRRRRRPVDLRLAARGRAARPGPRRRRCRACGGSTSRPTTAVRGRSSSAPSGSSSTTASGSRSGSCRARRPPAGSSSRRTPADDHVRVDARDADLARRRLDPRRPRADEPRAAAGGRRRARPRDPVPGAATCRCPIEDDRIDGLLDRLPPMAISPAARCPRSAGSDATSRRGSRDGATAADPRTGRRGRPRDRDARLGGPVPPTLARLRAAIDARRRRLAELRRDDAPLTLATAHGTKGLEWDHVASSCWPTGGSRARRSVADAAEPERALEEERRLAYVAWTRARRSLTLLYDPAAPSRFLLEAFTPRRARAVTATPPRRLAAALDSHGGWHAHAPRRHGADHRPRLGVPPPGRADGRPAVRDVVQRLRHVARRSPSGRRCRSRPRSSGSSARSRTRARTATTSSPASSPTTGRSAPSACSSSTSSTATPAWGSRSARPSDRGKGHGTDMLRALLAFGFDSLRLERIELDVYDFNADAHRLYQRIGFVDEGVARHRIFREGRHVDLHQMSMLAAEYRARSRRRDLAADVPFGERLEQPVDRVEEGLRDLLRQRVPDGVLRPVGRPRTHRRLAQVGDVVVAEPVRAAARSRRPSGRRRGRARRRPAGLRPARRPSPPRRSRGTGGGR